MYAKFVDKNTIQCAPSHYVTEHTDIQGFNALGPEMLAKYEFYQLVEKNTAESVSDDTHIGVPTYKLARPQDSSHPIIEVTYVPAEKPAEEPI